MIIKEDEKVIRIAENAKNVAILGISNNKERASYQIAQQLKKIYNILLINPKYANDKILGKTVYSSLKETNINVDIVDVFRNPQFAEELVKNAIDVKAGAVWFQPGAENIRVIDKYKDKIDIIYNKCLGVVSKMIL